MMKTCFLVFLAAVFVLLMAAPAAAVFFDGSDIAMGVGGEGIAMGGAFVSLADDLTALYWNPAALVLVEPGVYFSFDSPAVAVIGGEPDLGLDSTWQPSYMAFGGSFNASCGRFGWALGTNYRLRFSIPEITDFNGADWLGLLMRVPEGFTGSVTGSTTSYLAALAFSPAAEERISAGIAVEYMDASLNMAGLDPADDIYMVTRGYAITLSGRVQASDRLTLGVKLGNVYSNLTTTVTDVDGTCSNPNTLHTDLVLSASYKWDRLTLAADFEGLMGDSPLIGPGDANLLHLGVAIRLSDEWTLYGGGVVILQASTAGNPDLFDDLPTKVYSISIGTSYSVDAVSINFALVVNPILSLYGDGMVLSSVLSLNASF